MGWDIDFGTYDLGSETAIEALSFTRNRRISQSPVIRSHVTRIPLGNLQPLKIKIKGTITGSDYAALRSALEDLQEAVYNSKQNLELDTDRYAKCVLSNFGWSFKTQFHIKYNATFYAELPFWLDNTNGLDSRTPASGVGYNLSNAGQVKVPAKVVITAPAGGISDNIQFENTTLGLLFKYRGDLDAGKDLVVDMGYDNDNVHEFDVTNDGLPDMGNFEGDFIELAPGTNAFEYTGTSGATVKIYWREGYYN